MTLYSFIAMMGSETHRRHQKDGEKMNQQLDFLKQLAHGLAVQFGPSCEVVIHDLSGKDLDKSIVYIENGEVSNRHTGDGPSGIVLETLRSDPAKVRDRLAYLTKTADGRILKSSTMYIRDERGNIAYIFSLNYDITALLTVESALRDLTHTEPADPSERETDAPRTITHNVTELLDQLIEQAISGNVPVYHGTGEHTASSSGNAKSGGTGHKIYTQLMNGVSHMLPFVVGGGILIAIAFLIDGLSVDLNSLPADQRANFGTITPVAALFKGIGDTAFGFMLPVLAGFIAMAIGDRPALAVGFVGGMIASGGKSGFLGALVAGFAAGYIILGLRKLCSKLPPALEKIAPVLLYPVFGILIMGLAMNFIVEPIMGGINTALNAGLSGMGGTSKILLGLILGGMMAIDMGGPFNKAAYVFGTAAIAAGNYDIMAAVMIGGMTPPCAIALATLLFKNKFTKEQRETGPTNFIMGLAFITEGAIPFAASDPIHVLPSCIAGSAVAGALSMAFGCTLMAPHGGIFVFPVVGNALLYLVALIVGTVVSALLLGLLKKKVDES